MRHRDAQTMRFRALAIRRGQKIANLFNALLHKAWNPIPARVSQCLSTGGVDSAASRRRGGCEKSAEKASPRVRDAATMAIRAAETRAGQKIANLFHALLHKAWNPISARVSQCLSTGGVDSAASRRRGGCEKNAEKASPRVRDAATVAIRSTEIGAGQKIANLFNAALHKAWNPIPARVSQCLSTGGVDSGEACRVCSVGVGACARAASGAGRGAGAGRAFALMRRNRPPALVSARPRRPRAPSNAWTKNRQSRLSPAA